MRKTWDGRIIGKKYRLWGQASQFGMYFIFGLVFFSFYPYIFAGRNFVDFSPNSLAVIMIAVIGTMANHYVNDMTYVIEDQSVDDSGNVLYKFVYEDGVIHWEKPQLSFWSKVKRLIPKD